MAAQRPNVVTGHVIVHMLRYAQISPTGQAPCIQIYAAACKATVECHPYHSILGQLLDIGQNELVLQDLLHSGLRKPVAGYAVSCRVLAHLHHHDMACLLPSQPQAHMGQADLFTPCCSPPSASDDIQCSY